MTEQKKYDYGMIGLGTMGRNLVFNMNDHGFSVAGFDKTAAQVDLLQKEGKDKEVMATTNLEEFIGSLKTPRTIILLVPAGKIVDDVINELKPFLSGDDLLMDCGNSHFTDTNRRYTELEKAGLHFMGVGVSGGESGARFGPSIMPGGPKDVYKRVAPMLESIAAKVKEQPCVTWLGPGAAGHYVKMVHNGIEYGIMQLISETYHLLKVIGEKENKELHDIFSKWNEGVLRSFLIEITADIFLQKDELTNNMLVDMILDTAHQKGTGGWTSEDGLKLQVPITIIDTAVAVRGISSHKEERVEAEKILKGPIDVEKPNVSKNELVNFLEQALYFSMICTYAQGMALLKAASDEYKYDLNFSDIARVWSGGCIIRATLLQDIYTAYQSNTKFDNLMSDHELSQKLMHSQNGIRKIVSIAAESGIPAPAFMSALSYYDTSRSGWLPANLVQAQRDYFGAHTYERTDRGGTFHTHWK